MTGIWRTKNNDYICFGNSATKSIEKSRKMVTYFNKKDLVSFGNYLMSEKRKRRFEELNKQLIDDSQNPPPIEEKLNIVHHADIENWLAEGSFVNSKKYKNRKE